MYFARDIAMFVINWCKDKNIKITNLKLQKLLYFIQGENVRYKGTRLIRDDFYAWQLGPVVPSVYYEFAIYSSFELPRQIEQEVISHEEQAIIGKILDDYATISAWDLVDMSHEQDPWKYNYQIFGEGAIIPYESIEKYFGKA